MASSNSCVFLAYEHTPRYENAPTTSPYDVSTAGRYLPIQNFRLSPAPQMINREDELRGVEGAAAQLVDGFLPAGELSIRAYPNDLIFLLGLAGYKATVVAGTATLDVWTIAQGGTWTGGTFTLTVGAQVTQPIPYNATAAQVQVALANLSSVGQNCVVVSGGPLPGTLMTITFTGKLAGLAQTLTSTDTGLTGTTPTVTKVHTATGALGASPANPDGGGTPTGLNTWKFTKRLGLNAKTAQFQAIYLNEGVFVQGQGYGLTALGGNADGAITGTLMGLVFVRIPDPNLTPSYDASGIPFFRRGDIALTWLSGSGVSNDFTWSIANPLEAIRTLGLASFFPDTIYQGPGRVLVTGTIPKRALATADIDGLMAASVFSATVSYRSPKMIGATGNTLYPYSMFQVMPACQLVGGDPDPLTNQRRFGATFNYFASWDEVSGKDCEFTIISSLAETGVASAGVGL